MIRGTAVQYSNCASLGMYILRHSAPNFISAQDKPSPVFGCSSRDESLRAPTDTSITIQGENKEKCLMNQQLG